jgi:N-acetylglucosamine-6-phosphate deacetylase
MNSRYITGRDAIVGRSIRITVEDGCIRTIEDGPADEVMWLSPGFIDLQVNGYRGCDLNDDHVNPDVVIALVDHLLSAGTTAFLPTVITAPEDRILRALRAISKAREASPLVAHALPFIHLEGPHISPEDGARGAHPRESVRPPNLAEFERWQRESNGLVGMVTLSPHWENATEYVAALAAKGIVVAIGHTHAAPERIRAAVDAGAVLSTHLGNGVAPLLARHPNVIWTQLAEDRLTATFIADGHHLPMDTLKPMLRAKGIERSILVSDSVALAGMPPGMYDAAIGGQVELRADGRLSMVGTDFLAGAARPLRDGVAQVVNSSICSLSEAVRMATANPGRFVGNRGILRPGTSADLLTFTLDVSKHILQIHTVFVKGVELHSPSTTGTTA